MSVATARLPAFQRYQLEFAGHIRDPLHKAAPARVQPQRMQVYTELVFNNLLSAVSACFPVARKTLGETAWQQLVREFFRLHACSSPLFRQIPEELLRYLETAQNIPPYLKSLAHYEWIELALAVADVSLDMQQVDGEGDLLQGQPVFSPALALLSYDYPVHLISPQFIPEAALAEPVNFLVFRDQQDDVHFIELNPVTARLVGILQAEAVSGRAALEKIAQEMRHPEPEAVVGFGAPMLADLRLQGAILGTWRQTVS